MFRNCLLIMLFVCFINADIVNFKEDRYLFALDNSFSKEGIIKFEKNLIVVSYKSDSNILIYSDNKLIVQDDDNDYEVDLEKNIHMKIFFNILEAIYFDKQKKLQEFFTIKLVNNTVLLNPRDLVSNYISNISYRKTEKLDFLKIELINKDRIYIEEIN